MSESITKNRQPAAVLRAMVARAFGASQVPGGPGAADGTPWYEELDHGWFNVAYRIRLRDGRRVVLKTAPPSHVEVMTYERGLMRNETTALTLLADRTALPVPALLHYDDSHTLCDADWFFMEHVDGDNLQLVRDRLPAGVYTSCREQIGAANRTINALRGPGFGPLVSPAPAGTGWREVFTGLLESVLRDGERRGVDIGQDYDALRELIAAHAGSLDEVTEPVFVSWDLWDSNVMVSGGTVTGLIDHERALYGDPVMEAGFAGSELAGLGDPEAFLRGYGRGPLTPGERVRRRLYNLHLMLIMTVETVYRGHTDPAQYTVSRTGLAAAVRAFAHPLGSAARPVSTP